MDFKPRFRLLAEFLCPWIAVAAPLFMALPRLATDSVWRDDLPLLQGLGLVSVTGPSTLSTWLMLCASLVPFGSLTYRLAIVSSIGLAACGWLVFAFARQLLNTHVPQNAFNTPLALLASLCTTLVTSMQAEATIAAGATPTVACAMGALVILSHPTLAPWHRYSFGAIVVALLLSNHLVTGLVVAAGVIGALASIGSRRQRLAAKSRRIVLLSFVVSCFVLWAPWVLRAFAPNALHHFGLRLGQFDLPPLDISYQATTSFSAWRGDLGTVVLCFGVFGLLTGVVRVRTRPFVVPLVTIIVADAVLPSTAQSVLTTDAMMPVHCLAIASLAVGACVGVQAIVASLTDTGVAMAKAAAVLVLLFYVSLVGMLSERAAFSVDRSNMMGATKYTDEALTKLEPNAMVMVRSDAVLWRLYAANLTAGTRSDVVVVPLLLLGRGDQAAKLLAREPGSTLLLRDMALQATIEEHAFSIVADKRYLYVELDPSWDSSVASHLRAARLWLSAHPQPVARSDRRAAALQASKIIDQVARDVAASSANDTATAAVISGVVRQQTIAAAAANDRQAAQELLNGLAAVSPNDWFVKTMAQRMSFTEDATIDVSGLMR